MFLSYGCRNNSQDVTVHLVFYVYNISLYLCRNNSQESRVALQMVPVQIVATKCQHITFKYRNKSQDVTLHPECSTFMIAMRVHPEHIYVETFSRCDGSSCCSMFTVSTYLPYENVTVQALIETFCSLWSQNITDHNTVLVKSA